MKPTITEEQFKSLRPEQRRIEIAKDILLQLKARVYQTSKLCYLDVPDTDNVVNRDYLIAREQCFICGIGAAFVSAVRLGNDFEIVRSRDEDNYRQSMEYLVESQMRNVLWRYFSDTQIRLIENMYEGWPAFYSGESAKLVDRFSRKYPNKKDRLVVICENIIANDGTLELELLQ